MIIYTMQIKRGDISTPPKNVDFFGCVCYNRRVFGASKKILDNPKKSCYNDDVIDKVKKL